MMKKKIKELTIQETINICNNPKNEICGCINCPIYNICCRSPHIIETDYKNDLEKEIEL